MGLVRKVQNDSVAEGGAGDDDMASVIRQAVAAEIERQRLAGLQREEERDGPRTAGTD